MAGKAVNTLRSTLSKTPNVQPIRLRGSTLAMLSAPILVAAGSPSATLFTPQTVWWPEPSKHIQIARMRTGCSCAWCSAGYGNDEDLSDFIAPALPSVFNKVIGRPG
jgi:hypothetical protein